MKKINNQKGFAIYLILIILSILLAVSLNISTIIITASKMTGNLSDGVRAFHAADSGIEAALFSTKDACTPVSPNTVSGDSKYVYTITITGPCPAEGTTIFSEGVYNGVTKRTTEVKW